MLGATPALCYSSLTCHFIKWGDFLGLTRGRLKGPADRKTWRLVTGAPVSQGWFRWSGGGRSLSWRPVPQRHSGPGPAMIKAVPDPSWENDLHPILILGVGILRGGSVLRQCDGVLAIFFSDSFAFYRAVFFIHTFFPPSTSAAPRTLAVIRRWGSNSVSHRWRIHLWLVVQQSDRCACRDTCASRV